MCKTEKETQSWSAYLLLLCYLTNDFEEVLNIACRDFAFEIHKFGQESQQNFYLY